MPIYIILYKWFEGPEIKRVLLVDGRHVLVTGNLSLPVTIAGLEITFHLREAKGDLRQITVMLPSFRPLPDFLTVDQVLPVMPEYTLVLTSAHCIAVTMSERTNDTTKEGNPVLTVELDP